MPPSRTRPKRQFFGPLALGACVALGNGCTPPPPAYAPQASPESLAQSVPKQSLSALVNRVDAIGDDATYDQTTLADLLEDMGRALEPISHAGRLRVHEVARLLAGSPANSLSHAGLFKQGLELVLKALVPFSTPPARANDYRVALQALSQSTGAVQDLVPLVDQRTRATAALRAAVDAIFLARGGEPPFGEAESLDVPSTPLGPIDVELEQARADISKLARIPAMGSAPATGRALASLAQVLAAADSGEKTKAAIAEVRFEAERLKRGNETLKFGQAGWARAGLISVLDGLDDLQHGPAKMPSAWSQIARAAAVSIDERSSLVFQRPAIQDAFRATVDAFAKLAEPDAACPQTK